MLNGTQEVYLYKTLSVTQEYFGSALIHVEYRSTTFCYGFVEISPDRRASDTV